MGRDRIDLSWTAPTDDGGSAITGYRIESSADGSTGWSDLVADTGSDATTYSHTGLMPNTTLHYRVSAINGEGASDPSDSANATTDDYPAVTVQFGAGSYIVAEGGTQSITVELSADPERTVVIPITHTPQSGADSPADYSGVPANVTFITGQTFTSFTFEAIQDMDDDDGESVLLEFGMLPERVSAGTTATTTVSITDDDDPQVTVMFGAGSYTVAEGGMVTVAVTLSADPERTVVIPITATNEGGASDSDYTGVPPSVTFNSGDTSKTFSITAALDGLRESGERVKLSFGTLLGATAGTPAEATVSFSDNTQSQITPPTIHFGSMSYTVAEGDSVDVTVTLSKAPGSEAVIPLVSTAQRGADFDDYTVQTSVTFDASETSKTITFSATQDTDDDDGESVLLDFGTPPGGLTATTGEASETTVSITDDDDTPAVVFSETGLTVTEGDAAGSSYTVKLATRALGRAWRSPSTGHASTDLSLDKTSLTFTVGNWDVAQTVTVTAAEDDDGVTDVGVTLTHTVSGGGYGSTTVPDVEVSITENDTAGLVISKDSLTVGEDRRRGVE